MGTEAFPPPDPVPDLVRFEVAKLERVEPKQNIVDSLEITKLNYTHSNWHLVHAFEVLEASRPLDPIEHKGRQRKPSFRRSASFKLIENCLPIFFRPSWLSRSHESLVFNSVHSPNQNAGSGLLLSNQMRLDASANGSREGWTPNEVGLSHSHNFAPIHCSQSQYFSSHQSRPSLALDSSENLLLNSRTAAVAAHENNSQSTPVNLRARKAAGATSVITNNDNYLHMNGGPNGMGPSPMIGAAAMNPASVSARTGSTSNLLMHSSTLDKHQKLDRYVHFITSLFSKSLCVSCWLPSTSLNASCNVIM